MFGSPLPARRRVDLFIIILVVLSSSSFASESEDISKDTVEKWLRGITSNKDNPRGSRRVIPFGGVLESRVHPHWMVTGLKRLYASTEKDLQQVHPSHPVADKLDDPLDQRLHLRLLFWDHPQGECAGALESK